MKKLFSLFLIVTMLATMMAAFAINTSAETTPLTAKIYSVSGDGYVYLVFNKKVATPAADATVSFALCALGWPADVDGDGNPDLRDIRRVEYAYQGVVGESGQVWKFAVMANGAPSVDHIGWGLGGGNINAEDVAGGVSPNGGYWFYALLGDIYTADNAEQLVLDRPTILNGDGTTYAPGHLLVKTDAANSTGAVTTVASVDAIEVPAPLDSIKPEAPETFDALTIVALVGLAASGAIVATKKRH